MHVVSHPSLVFLHLNERVSLTTAVFPIVITPFSLLTSTQHLLYALDAHPLPHYIPFCSLHLINIVQTVLDILL